MTVRRGSVFVVVALALAAARPAWAGDLTVVSLPVVGEAASVEPPPQRSPSQVPMVHRTRVGLTVAGGITFGVSWGLSAMTSILLLGSPCHDSGGCDDARVGTYFWIPIAGPVIAATQTHRSQNRVMFGAWSLVEAAGFTLLVIGLAGKDVPDGRAIRTSHTSREIGGLLSLAPMITPGTAGITAIARW